MRIGLVLEQFDPARGGREQWTWAFTQRLLELGHEVHVVARSCSAKARQLPIAYHPVQCDPSPIVFAEAVRAVLEPLALDIVHDMGMGWYCDVFHPHGGSMAASAERKLLFLPAWLRGLKRMANRLLPRHRTFRDLMARQYADHGQIVLALVAGIGRRLPAFSRRRSAADPPRLQRRRLRAFFAGTLPAASRSGAASARPWPRHGCRADRGPQFPPQGRGHAAEGDAALARPGRDLRLLIVGGKHIDSWQRHVARAGLSEQVIFAGRVDDPLPYYAAADFYVHPTYYDPCSLVVLEAAACGLPLITSRYNGASEMFTDGDDVLLDRRSGRRPRAGRGDADAAGRWYAAAAGRGGATRRYCNIRSSETSIRFWKSIARSSIAATACRTATEYSPDGSRAAIQARRGTRVRVSERKQLPSPARWASILHLRTPMRAVRKTHWR